MLRALALAVLLCGLGAAPAAAEPEWSYDVANELMSPFCPGRTLADCPSGDAEELRRWIRAQEEAGVPREEVEAQIVARYGEEVLPTPKPEGVGIIAYVFPAAAFVAGGVLVAVFLRRQTRSAPPAAPISAVDPELERLVDEELRA